MLAGVQAEVEAGDRGCRYCLPCLMGVTQLRYSLGACSSIAPSALQAKQQVWLACVAKDSRQSLILINWQHVVRLGGYQAFRPVEIHGVP